MSPVRREHQQPDGQRRCKPEPRQQIHVCVSVHLKSVQQCGRNDVVRQTLGHGDSGRASSPHGIEPDSQYSIPYATHGYLGFEDGEPL